MDGLNIIVSNPHKLLKSLVFKKYSLVLNSEPTKIRHFNKVHYHQKYQQNQRPLFNQFCTNSFKRYRMEGK
ncbi:MAG: hypothetical protein DRR00_28360 [Candidatus Parabeggiatoa sp. nov. 3]|nr:MAG: hypothetical protein DRR00_28360 [Gammaproteobacteria bacterium]RKZ61052.1 MAG: hypothetical protein DRQ99_21055 [Gammaproteobacteria bacterium]